MGYLLITNADGRSRTSQATLAALQDLMGDGIEASWDRVLEEYLAQPLVHLWNMPKSWGYIVSLSKAAIDKQINVGFFQDPVSDEITVVKCETGKNDNIRATDFPKGSQASFCIKHFAHDDVYKAASYILRALIEFWYGKYATPVEECTHG